MTCRVFWTNPEGEKFQVGDDFPDAQSAHEFVAAQKHWKETINLSVEEVKE